MYSTPHAGRNHLDIYSLQETLINSKYGYSNLTQSHNQLTRKANSALYGYNNAHFDISYTTAYKFDGVKSS